MTVSAPAPHAGRATVEVRARAARSPPARAVAVVERDAGAWRWWPIAAGVLTTLVILAMVVSTARRRRKVLR